MIDKEKTNNISKSTPQYCKYSIKSILNIPNPPFDLIKNNRFTKNLAVTETLRKSVPRGTDLILIFYDFIKFRTEPLFACLHS